METILHHLQGIFVYLDDIFITGSTLAKNQSNLEGVQDRHSKVDLQLNEEKCAFLLEQIKYLGHMIDAQGLHPS